MTPIEKERYIECIQRAKILSNASELYLKAAQVIEAGATGFVELFGSSNDV